MALGIHCLRAFLNVRPLDPGVWPPAQFIPSSRPGLGCSGVLLSDLPEKRGNCPTRLKHCGTWRASKEHPLRRSKTPPIRVRTPDTGGPVSASLLEQFRQARGQMNAGKHVFPTPFLSYDEKCLRSIVRGDSRCLRVGGLICKWGSVPHHATSAHDANRMRA